MTIRLIRGGEVIKTIEGKPPIKLEYRDEGIPKGRKTYYRVMVLGLESMEQAQAAIMKLKNTGFEGFITFGDF